MPSIQVGVGEQESEGVDCDDLTLIRGIDGALSTRLREMHVTRFETISKWSAEDVARVAGGIGSPQQISEQNWIEQAAILASGELTHHARRVRRGEFKCLVREADEPDPPTEVAPIFSASTDLSAKQTVVELALGFQKAANPVSLLEETEGVAPSVELNTPLDMASSGKVVQFNQHARLQSHRTWRRMVASLLLAVMMGATIYSLRSPTLASLAQAQDAHRTNWGRSDSP